MSNNAIPKKIAGTLIAWLPTYAGPQDLAGSTEKALNCIVYSNNECMGKGDHPWTRIGTAEITVTLISEDQMIENKVSGLRETKKQLLADTELKANQIERQIQSLLAIGMDAPAVDIKESDIPF